MGISAAIDALVTTLSPERGMKRVAARQALNVMASYKGAGRGRLRASWNPGNKSANAEIERDLPLLRARARQLNRDDGTAAGLTQTLVANIVGTGSNPQARVDFGALGLTEEQGEALNEQIEAAFKRFSRKADVTGQLSFADCQALVLRQKIESGEFLVALEVISRQIALNMIEPDRLDLSLNKQGEEGDRIRMGVEVDGRGAPVAYHILESHPGDIRGKGSNTAKRYARFDGWRPKMLHGFRYERPGQTRGVPWAAPVLDLFDDFSQYMEAERVAARVAACFAVFIKKVNPYGAAEAAAEETQSDGKRLEGLEAGMIQYLGENEEMQGFSPNRPGSTFDMFVMRLLRIIASAFGLPYELVSMDFSKANYSNMRAALLEARRMFKTHQQQLEHTFCQPIYERVVELAILRGEIALPYAVFEANREAVCRARWIHPGWGWVDPEKEVDSALKAIAGGLSSLADETANNGRDWEDVQDQRKREIGRARGKGLETFPVIAEALSNLRLGGYVADAAQLSSAIGFDIKEAPEPVAKPAPAAPTANGRVH